MFDSEGVKIPGIKKLSVYKQEVNLTRDIFSIPGPSTQHVGVGISYRKIVTQTGQGLLDDIPYLKPSDFPGEIHLCDGLDGSGSHSKFQQKLPEELDTRSILFFGFKCLSIRNASKCIWKNSLANSAFSLRPIGLLSLPESYENVKFAMDTLINHETEDLKVNGIETSYGKLFSIHSFPI